jgi:hypothetical protein
MLALAVGGALFAAACGDGGSTLPEPAICPTPTAAPAVVAGRQADGAYLRAVTQQTDRLKQANIRFLEKWSSRKFAGTAEFREDLALMSDQAACVASQVQALSPPSERYSAYDAELDGVLADYIQGMALAREAARQRNVSKFRDWLKVVDDLPGALDAARATLPAPVPRN